jgi:hypothetical protein
MPPCGTAMEMRKMPNRWGIPAVFAFGLVVAAQGQAADEPTAVPVALSPVTVNSYPAPMLDVDGSRKYVAVVASRGVEIRQCQHMVVTQLNYLACEFNDGAKSYNVVIPIVREAVDVREPWSTVAPGVYR